MKTTSYAKFDAHKRYSRLNNTSLFALTSASLLLIFISILNKFSSESCPVITPILLELFSLVTAIIILVLSLVVAFASYAMKSERQLRFGNEIKSLSDNLTLIEDNDIDRIRKINDTYSLFRASFDNHHEFNYQRGRLERKKEEGGPLKDEDKVDDMKTVEYWAPITGYYLISILSCFISIFLFFKFIQHA
ncbi:MAG: SLATT domain-containing protein [Psychromonas sp.]